MISGQTSWQRLRNGTSSTVLPGHEARSTCLPCWSVNRRCRSAAGTGRRIVVPSPADPALAGGDAEGLRDPDVEVVVDRPHPVVPSATPTTHITIGIALFMDWSSRD